MKNVRRSMALTILTVFMAFVVLMCAAGIVLVIEEIGTINDWQYMSWSIQRWLTLIGLAGTIITLMIWGIFQLSVKGFDHVVKKWTTKAS